MLDVQIEKQIHIFKDSNWFQFFGLNERGSQPILMDEIRFSTA